MKHAPAVFFLLAALAPCAHADLTPFPGARTARVQSVLPDEIGFHVTDAAGRSVQSAYVQLSVVSGPASPIPQLPALVGIPAAPSYAQLSSDQDGNTTYAGDVYAVAAGTYVLHATSDYGNADVTLNIVDGPRPDRIELVGGASQSAAAGTLFAEPFSVRVIDTAGQPFPRPHVVFFQFYHSSHLYTAAGNFESFMGDYTTDIGTTTDMNGIATTASPFRALLFPGDGVVSAQVLRAEAANQAATIDIPFAVTAPPPSVPSSYQDMWWGGDSQNGWGMALIEHDRRIFALIYAYDFLGAPIWYAVPDCTWHQAEGASLGGTLYEPTGSPYSAFDTSSIVVGPAQGTMSITFESPDTAILTIAGKSGGARSVQKKIQRMTYGDPAGSTRGVGDMWWGGPSQSGWGVSVLEHAGTLFSIWFTYGADRKATWFVMPGGSWNELGNYVGDLYTTSNQTWFLGPYDPGQLTVTKVGAYTLHVDNPASAMRLDYLINGAGGTLPLSREPF